MRIDARTHTHMPKHQRKVRSWPQNSDQPCDGQDRRNSRKHIRQMANARTPPSHAVVAPTSSSRRMAVERRENIVTYITHIQLDVMMWST